MTNTTPRAAEAARLGEELKRLISANADLTSGHAAEINATIDRLRDLASRADWPVGEAADDEERETAAWRELQAEHDRNVAHLHEVISQHSSDAMHWFRACNESRDCLRHVLEECKDSVDCGNGYINVGRIEEIVARDAWDKTITDVLSVAADKRPAAKEE